MLIPLIARVLRLASIAICAIAVMWFLAFALEQSKNASEHQQAEVSEAGPTPPATTTTGGAGSGKPSGAREALDKAFSKLSSPFSGVTAGSSSAWKVHIVDTLLVLLVYGFGLAFLGRLLRLGRL